ncbi:17057_t:CDS:2 [Dentiscutata erythropus]|uniref:17057_t:CDS:1 n=1 Tax=Dentiscutata erythropus TaxID=1348616 RepID=A0A9N9GBI0_9GLOM|nr:17057_t:CDS:2 [Dentiscutata erythropus]
MPSHISLLIVIISGKNNRYSSYGVAKYKLSNQISRTIKWKYFFSSSKSPQLFNPGDIIFISSKYVVENYEKCVTIAYASIINTGKPEREFDITSIPICIPHLMISVNDTNVMDENEEEDQPKKRKRNVRTIKKEKCEEEKEIHSDKDTKAMDENEEEDQSKKRKQNIRTIKKEKEKKVVR